MRRGNGLGVSALVAHESLHLGLRLDHLGAQQRELLGGALLQGVTLGLDCQLHRVQALVLLAQALLLLAALRAQRARHVLHVHQQALEAVALGLGRLCAQPGLLLHLRQQPLAGLHLPVLGGVEAPVFGHELLLEQADATRRALELPRQLVQHGSVARALLDGVYLLLLDSLEGQDRLGMPPLNGDNLLFLAALRIV